MMTLTTKQTFVIELIVYLLLLLVNLIVAQDNYLNLNSASKDLPSWTSLSAQTKLRQKRNIVQLATKTARQTKFSTLKLAHYGNWCGKGGDRKGDGSVIDGCDLCCKKHDLCYRRTRTTYEGCNPVTVTYNSRFDKEKDREICENEESGCAHGICRCDLNFVNCLKKEPCSPLQVYNSVSYFWWLGL